MPKRCMYYILFVRGSKEKIFVFSDMKFRKVYFAVNPERILTELFTKLNLSFIPREIYFRRRVFFILTDFFPFAQTGAS